MWCGVGWCDVLAHNEMYKAGVLPLRFGEVFVKGQRIQAGQCPVLSYNRELLISILRDRLRVANALNVEVIGLDQAPEAYRRFSSGHKHSAQHALMHTDCR